MSIRVTERRGKTTVETDYRDSGGSDHSRAHSDYELLGAMRSSGIDRVEGSSNGYNSTRSSLREDFDRQYESITGRKKFGW